MPCQRSQSNSQSQYLAWSFSKDIELQIVISFSAKQNWTQKKSVSYIL